MEEIEVVIKIPKILYAQIQSDAEIMIYSGMRSWKGILATLLRSVRNGTPLPKGYGDLIDRRELEECKEIMNTISGESKYVVRMDDIRDAPTIIEADKEDKA